jgi:lipid-A-disaccharide synthase-like uncharacterized protein
MEDTFQQLLAWLQANVDLWVVIGLFGQFLFTMRLVTQWWASERVKKSVMPDAFWYFSLLGGLITFIYAVHKHDIVFMLAQGTGILIYSRNVYFIWRNKRVPNPNA